MQVHTSDGGYFRALEHEIKFNMCWTYTRLLVSFTLTSLTCDIVLIAAVMGFQVQTMYDEERHASEIMQKALTDAEATIESLRVPFPSLVNFIM